ncbi:unnamed protein product, partial [Adineta steineri]
QKLDDALTEKFVNAIPSQDDRHIKCHRNLIKARLVHGKANQSRIAYLIDPTKDRVKTDNEMMENCGNCYHFIKMVNTAKEKSYFYDRFRNGLLTLLQEESEL